MSINSIKNTSVIAAVLVGVSGLASTVEPAAAVQPAVFLRQTTASTNLSNSGSPVVMVKVTIPAGKWVVYAKANPVNFGGADYVRCRILVGGVQKDAAATLVGNAAVGPTGETGPSVAEIVLHTAVVTTGSKVFTLDCLHDFATTGEYVDLGASILVVQAPGPLG